MRPEEPVDGAGDGLQAVLRLLRQLDAAGHHRQGLRHRPVRRRSRLHGRLHPDDLHRAGGPGHPGRDTIVVINSDHGETLYDHDCYFDHHGLYDQTLHVPLILRYPGKVPAGKRVAGYNTQHKTWCRPSWSWPGSRAGSRSTARACCRWCAAKWPRTTASSTSPSAPGCASTAGARPQWKLIDALEPDFHFKPPVELYNLVEDPGETSQPGRDGAEDGGCPAQAHGRLDRPARERDRPAQPDLQPGRLARSQRRRRVQDLAAGLRHAAHRRPRTGRQAAIGITK